MGNDQYAPEGALLKAENRLFTQFYAQYPLKEKLMVSLKANRS